MSYVKPRYSVDRVSAKVRKKQFISRFLKENKKGINDTNNELWREARKKKREEARAAKLLAEKSLKKKN